MIILKVQRKKRQIIRRKEKRREDGFHFQSKFDEVCSPSRNRGLKKHYSKKPEN